MPLFGRSDAEGFHFAVEVAALEPQGECGLCHVPPMFLQFPQNEFAFISAAGLVQCGIRLLRTLCDASEQLGREMVWFDARLRADDDQAFD